MIPVSRQYYSAMLPLVRASGLHGHLAFAYAVLEHRQGGRVFADSITAPRALVVCNDSGFWLAFGAPLEKEVEALVLHLRGTPRPEPNSALFSSSPEWDAILTPLWNGFDPPLRRLGFNNHLQPGRPPTDWRDRIPPGFTMQSIDERLAEGILDGTATGNFGIDPWFIRVAGGPHAYAAQGLGSALVRADGQIASLCGFCGLGGGEAELEVGTPLEFQGKGYATLASAAFLEQCAEKGWKPVYTCDSTNQPSIAVAHKLGYVEVEEILGFKL